MGNEVWRPVKDFEGYYWVSDHGRIKNANDEIMSLQNKDGNYWVTLNGGGSGGVILGVARLVAIAFIPNPKSYPVVYHKTDDYLNNHYTNIAWGNRSSTHHSTTTVRKPVAAIDLDGNFVAEYPNMAAAASAHGVGSLSIRKVVKGYRNTAAGLQWVYLEVLKKIKNYKTIKLHKCRQCGNMKEHEHFHMKLASNGRVLDVVCNHCKILNKRCKALFKKIQLETATRGELEEFADIIQQYDNMGYSMYKQLLIANTKFARR